MSRRPDQHEQAARRLNAGEWPYEPLPQELRRFGRTRLMIVLAVVALVVGVLFQHRGNGLVVKGSCTTPGFALDRTTVQVYGAVKWAAVGPSGSDVIVTLDSTSANAGRIVGPVTLYGCRASGRFTAAMTPGEHVLRVYLRDQSTSLIEQQTLGVRRA